MAKSRKKRIIKEFELDCAILSNSFCIFSSILSEIVSAPFLATSIAAEAAIDVTKPAGVSRRMKSIL